MTSRTISEMVDLLARLPAPPTIEERDVGEIREREVPEEPGSPLENGARHVP